MAHYHVQIEFHDLLAHTLGLDKKLHREMARQGFCMLIKTGTIDDSSPHYLHNGSYTKTSTVTMRVNTILRSIGTTADVTVTEVTPDELGRRGFTIKLSTPKRFAIINDTLVEIPD